MFNRRLFLETSAAILFNSTPPPNTRRSQVTFNTITQGYASASIDHAVKGDLLESHDLAAEAGYDFTGAKKYVWFGQASYLTSKFDAASSLARQCLQVAGVQEKKCLPWLTTQLRSYFDPSFVYPNSLACVFVNVGHIRWAKTLRANEIRYSPNSTEQGEAPNQNDLFLQESTISLRGAPKKMMIPVLDFPWQMVSPAGRNDITIRQRIVTKKFRQGGMIDPYRDYMVQYGPGDASPTGYNKFITGVGNTGYFQNTEQIRQASNRIQFTDTTALNLVRVAHHGSPPDTPMVHHSIINLNAGVGNGALRRDRVQGIIHNPDQMLNYDVVVSPLYRFMRVYEDLLQLLHQRLFSVS